MGLHLPKMHKKMTQIGMFCVRSKNRIMIQETTAEKETFEAKQPIY